jgi:hypothetical protein
MRRKSPPDQKRDSYLKDRRNTYGENSKSSRKNIRLGKRLTARGNRRKTRHAIAANLPNCSENADFLPAVQHTRRKKVPDTPLGIVVQRKLARRIKLGIDQPQSGRTKISKIKARMR